MFSLFAATWVVAAVITPERFSFGEYLPGNKTTRTALLIAAICVVSLVGGAFYIAANFMSPTRPHFVTDSTEWPEPLRTLADSSPSITNSIQVYAIQPLPDQRSVWFVDNSIESIDAIVRGNSLEATTFDHPKFPELIRAMPSEWPAIDHNASTVFTTSGFGSIHQEGVDLFLVVRNNKTGNAVILHEWIF